MQRSCNTLQGIALNHTSPSSLPPSEGVFLCSLTCAHAQYNIRAHTSNVRAYKIRVGLHITHAGRLWAYVGTHPSSRIRPPEPRAHLWTSTELMCPHLEAQSVRFCPQSWASNRLAMDFQPPIVEAQETSWTTAGRPYNARGRSKPFAWLSTHESGRSQEARGFVWTHVGISWRGVETVWEDVGV